jgi:DNA-binding XRE family transcriptional regulator
MITAAQLRAARGLLDWTRADLAKAANISPETVKNIEHGTFNPQEGTANAIIQAFLTFDVEFTSDEGVRIKRDNIKRFEGVEGFKRFMDDVYKISQDPAAAVDGDKPICLSCSEDGLFSKYLGDYFDLHARRMNALKNVKMKILTKEKPTFKLAEETVENSYRQYRWFTQQQSGNVPFYVYGDKLAILIFGKDDVSIVVISSTPVAKAYREQFDVLWQLAKPLDQTDDPRGTR